MNHKINIEKEDKKHNHISLHYSEKGEGRERVKQSLSDVG
jgi:hypothetical protein